jgi:hypothetical protein
MSAFMFRAKIKNEHADEAEAAVKHMFAVVKKGTSGRRSLRLHAATRQANLCGACAVARGS